MILSPDQEIPGLNDSKKLSEKKREALYDVIRQEALSFCIASASEAEIDELNILGATFLAMHRAVEGLSQRPDLVLVDGNRGPQAGAAHRDSDQGGCPVSIHRSGLDPGQGGAGHGYMVELDQQYPEYNFRKHKGYPTKEHYERLTEHGILPVHRRSFLKKFTGASHECAGTVRRGVHSQVAAGLRLYRSGAQLAPRAR